MFKTILAMGIFFALSACTTTAVTKETKVAELEKSEKVEAQSEKKKTRTKTCKRRSTGSRIGARC